MKNKDLDREILEKLSPLVEMQFLLNLSGNKERDDFIYISNKADAVELCLWDNKSSIISENFKSARIAIHPNKTLVAYIKDCEGD